MIKDTLEELKKDFYCPQYIPIDGDDFREQFIIINKVKLERFILTSHISYLDEKIKEIDRFIIPENAKLCGGTADNEKYVKFSSNTMLDLLKSSLQKEKSQAEELLKGL